MVKTVILRKILLVISALTVIVPQGSSFESPKTNWAEKLDHRQITSSQKLNIMVFSFFLFY
jgi:hypothetical protein